MEGTTLFLISLGVVLIVVVLFLLRFRGEGRAEVSILNWLRLKIYGSNATENKEARRSVNVDVSDSSNVTVGDVVGRDKITNVYEQGSATTDDSKPDLVLRLWDREGNHTQDLSVPLLATSFPRDLVFRIAAANQAESTRAKGIGIRLELSWRGTPPTKAPRLSRTSIPEGWEVENPTITNSRPAVIRFYGPHLVLFNSHPRDWGNFRLRVGERLEGHFLLQYKISSHEPFSEGNGDLVLRLEYV